MNFLKLIKLNKLLKENNLEGPEVLEFLGKVKNKDILQSAGYFVDSLNTTGVKAKYVKPQTSLSELEIDNIQAELKADLFKRIQGEFEELLKSRIYHKPVIVKKNGDEVVERIHNRVGKIESLSPLLRYIANNYSENFCYSNPRIHATISVIVSMTPDTVINSIKVEAKKISLKVGMEKDYTKTEGKQSYFNQLYTFSFEQPALFYKDMSLLQIFCRFGLDDMIEKSIVYGADINYKEVSTNSTALDFYNANKPALNPANLTSFTTSLLDGSYNDGYYQTLYEKKKLESVVSVISGVELDKPKKPMKL